MSDENPTIFGKILRGEIPADRVWEDEHCIAFRDINPAAPTHILVIPRKHIPTTNDIALEDKELVGHLVVVAGQIAAQEGLALLGAQVVVVFGMDELNIELVSIGRVTAEGILRHQGT